MHSRLLSYALGEKKVKRVKIISGEDLTLADRSEYRGRNLSSLNITAYPELPFQAYLQFTTASSGDIAVSFPQSQYYGDTMPVFGNGEAWEINIKDGIIVALPLANAFTITYAANGGSGTVEDARVYLYGDWVTLANGEGLTYEGYTLSGWNTAEDGSGTAYALSANLALMASLTLYAVWTAV